MKKSVWKLNYIHPMFFKLKIYKKTTIGVSNYRHSSIIPQLIGRKIYIYNGAWKLTKKIDVSMLGLKIGEFSKTKEFSCQSQTKQKSKRKSK